MMMRPSQRLSGLQESRPGPKPRQLQEQRRLPTGTEGMALRLGQSRQTVPLRLVHQRRYQYVNAPRDDLTQLFFMCTGDVSDKEAARGTCASTTTGEERGAWRWLKLWLDATTSAA